MTDIVERLRRGATNGVLIPCEDLVKAADIIEQYRADSTSDELTIANLARDLAASQGSAGGEQSEVQTAVAWRCKDYADGWIYTSKEQEAKDYQATTGCLMQPLFTTAAQAPWKSISSAPKDGTSVLLAIKDADNEWCQVQGWYEAGVADRQWYDVYHGPIQPDYWKPLDAPPSPAYSVPSAEPCGHCWCGLHVTLKDQCDRCMKRGAFAVPSASQNTPAPPDVEIERLRSVAWAAQGMLNADTYVSSVPREQAVREATLKLQQALGTWQMHHTAASAVTSTDLGSGK